MKTSRARAAGTALVVGLVLGLAAEARGQTTLAANCRADNVWAIDPATLDEPWSTFHPRETATLAKERWSTHEDAEAAAAQIEMAFRAMAAAAELDDARRTWILDEIEAMEADLEQSGGSTQGVANQGRFDPTPGPDRYEFYGVTGGPLTVSDTDGVEAIRAICWTAIAADELLGLANRPARTAALEELSDAVAAWDAFNDAGYAQYPWELFLNRPDGLRPPKVQVILLHPGVGLEVTGLSELETARRTETVLTEIAGVLLYNDRRTFYGGLSVVLSLAADESPGLGGMAHIGPFLKVGYVFRAEPEDENRDGILVTADLLQLLSDAPALYQQAQARVTELLRGALSP